MLESLGKGIFRRALPPAYGRQDLGITPGGAMDLFSLATGNILLGNAEGAEALELVFPPPFRFREDTFFVLTGAAHRRVRLKHEGGREEAIEHARVSFAPEGSRITFGERTLGLRTYLCFRKAEGLDGQQRSRLLERDRGPFDAIARWPDPNGRIRVLEGPEHKHLNDPAAFFSGPWKVTREVSEMGMRIASDTLRLSVSLGNMVSAAVADGTVQLTPKGPIILLRHRQTVGGYPRIYNVITADMDLLGQFEPEQILRFRKVTLAEARAANRIRLEDLDTLKRRFEPL